MLVPTSLHHPRYELSRYRAAPFIRLDTTLPRALAHLSGVSPLSAFVAARITPATQVSVGTKSHNSLSFSISRAARLGKRVWKTHSRSSLFSCLHRQILFCLCVLPPNHQYLLALSRLDFPSSIRHIPIILQAGLQRLTLIPTFSSVTLISICSFLMRQPFLLHQGKPPRLARAKRR